MEDDRKWGVVFVKAAASPHPAGLREEVPWRVILAQRVALMFGGVEWSEVGDCWMKHPEISFVGRKIERPKREPEEAWNLWVQIQSCLSSRAAFGREGTQECGGFLVLC